MKIKIWIIILLLLVPCAAAFESSGKMKLLAVSELNEEIYIGSVADLTLEIQDGSGRVFVNTFPVSKLDTQMSMRFAKQIACKHSETDCSNYDFIYTIKASSSLVGGPSAGAAASVLTVSVLKKLDLNEKVAITGTINSGKLIGTVGGIKEKIDAAAKAGITKVLVPSGELSFNESSNETSVKEIADELGIEVIEVSTLGDAIYHFTGEEEEKEKKVLEVNEEYQRIMKYLANMLCERSEELQKKYLEKQANNMFDEEMAKTENIAINNTIKAKNAFEKGDYYTSASYCFRANINYNYIIHYIRNLSTNESIKLAENLDEEIKLFEKNIKKKEINTITDMQAYMITKERIDEAKDTKNKAIDKIKNNNTKSAAYWLAFSKERFYSAFTWSHFFGSKDQAFEINEKTLLEACKIKISEAEERYQYVNFYFPDILSTTKEGIENAKKDLQIKDFMMCIYKASKAKANANVVLGLIGVEKENIGNILNLKINAAEATIIDQQEEGIFPIMGYSYFEYAKSLKNEDPPSAIIYSEYALELSNFDFYFEKKINNNFPNIDKNKIFMLIIGICVGFLIGKNLKPHTKK